MTEVILCGMMGADMYIPTQEERYSKVAPFTLLLCIIVPSAFVAFAFSEMGFMSILGAFAWPLAYPIFIMTGKMGLGMMISSMLQFIAYMLLRRAAWPAKRKTTIAICWGMGLALAVRIILAYELYVVVLNGLAE